MSTSINSDEEDDSEFVEDIGNMEEIGIDENIEVVEVTCDDDDDEEEVEEETVENVIYQDDASSIASEYLDTDSTNSQMDVVEITEEAQEDATSTVQVINLPSSFQLKPCVKQYSRKSAHSFSPLVVDDWDSIPVDIAPSSSSNETTSVERPSTIVTTSVSVVAIETPRQEERKVVVERIEHIEDDIVEFPPLNMAAPLQTKSDKPQALINRAGPNHSYSKNQSTDKLCDKTTTALNVKTGTLKPIVVPSTSMETKINTALNIKSSSQKPFVVPSTSRGNKSASSLNIKTETQPLMLSSPTKETNISSVLNKGSATQKPNVMSSHTKTSTSIGSAAQPTLVPNTSRKTDSVVHQTVPSTDVEVKPESNTKIQRISCENFKVLESGNVGRLNEQISSTSQQPVLISSKSNDESIIPTSKIEKRTLSISEFIEKTQQLLIKSRTADSLTKVGESSPNKSVEPLSANVSDSIFPEKDTYLAETDSSTKSVDKKFNNESNAPNNTNESANQIPETGSNLPESITSKIDDKMDNKSNNLPERITSKIDDKMDNKSNDVINIPDTTNVETVANIPDGTSHTVNKPITNIEEDINQDDDDENYEDIEDSLVETPNPVVKIANKTTGKYPRKNKPKRKKRYILSARRRTRERKSIEQDVVKENPVNDEVEDTVVNSEDIEASSPSTENTEEVDENSGDASTVSERVKENKSEESVKNDVDTSENIEKFEEQEKKGNKGTSKTKKLTKRRRVTKIDSEIQRIDSTETNMEELDKHVEDTKNDTELFPNSTSSSLVGSKCSPVSKSNKPGGTSMKELLENKTSMNEINIEEMYQQLINNCQSESSQDETSYSENFCLNKTVADVKSSDSRNDSQPDISSEILDETLENDDSDINCKNEVKPATVCEVNESPSKARGRPRKYQKGEEPYLKGKKSLTNTPDKGSPEIGSSPSPSGKRGRPRKILDDEGKPVIISPPRPSIALTKAKRIVNRVVPFKCIIKSTESRNPLERRGRPRKYPKGQEPSPITYMKKYQLKRLKDQILTCQRTPKCVNSVEHEDFKGFKRVITPKVAGLIEKTVAGAEISVKSEQVVKVELEDLDEESASKRDVTIQNKDSNLVQLESSDTTAKQVDPTSEDIKETNTKSTDGETNDPETDKTGIEEINDQSNKTLVDKEVVSKTSHSTPSKNQSETDLTEEVSGESKTDNKSPEKVENEVKIKTVVDKSDSSETLDEKLSLIDTTPMSTTGNKPSDGITRVSTHENISSKDTSLTIPVETPSSIDNKEELLVGNISLTDLTSVDDLLVQLRSFKIKAKQDISKDLKNLYSLRNISLVMEKDDDVDSGNDNDVKEEDVSADGGGVRKRGRPRKNPNVLVVKHGRRGRKPGAGGLFQIQLKKMKRIRVRKQGKKVDNGVDTALVLHAGYPGSNPGGGNNLSLWFVCSGLTQSREDNE
ncbi:hypothetical protein WDU94_002789 [Cyamophila willieti]